MYFDSVGITLSGGIWLFAPCPWFMGHIHWVCWQGGITSSPCWHVGHLSTFEWPWVGHLICGQPFNWDQVFPYSLRGLDVGHANDIYLSTNNTSSFGILWPLIICQMDCIRQIIVAHKVSDFIKLIFCLLPSLSWFLKAMYSLKASHFPYWQRGGHQFVTHIWDWVWHVDEPVDFRYFVWGGVL